MSIFYEKYSTTQQRQPILFGKQPAGKGIEESSTIA